MEGHQINITAKSGMMSAATSCQMPNALSQCSGNVRERDSNTITSAYLYLLLDLLTLSHRRASGASSPRMCGH